MVYVITILLVCLLAHCSDDDTVAVLMNVPMKVVDGAIFKA